VEAFLAEGGMARLWRVRHVESGVPGALKVSRSREPELLARVAREGRIQRAIRHPNVLAALDVVEVEGTPGLVLQLVEGGLTLETELQRGRLTGEALERAVLGLLDGVEAAHRAGYIHRDLKPANVLLAEAPGGWAPRVADFGLARPEFEPPEAKMTRAGFILGSAAYMAPEQARDAGSVDARADVWSLGVMIYEMVAGVPPFSGATLEEVLTQVSRARFRPLDSLVPDVAARWQVAVEACLHVDPEMRAPDVATLRTIVLGQRGWVSEGGGARRRSLPGVAAPRLPARRAPTPAPIPPGSPSRPGSETFQPDLAADEAPRSRRGLLLLAGALALAAAVAGWAAFAR
jgi:serine/threonine-protein kinase